MKLLLDSCTFLWLIWDEMELCETARLTIADSRNEVFLSAASVWEITVKHLAGKLVLHRPVDPSHFYTEQRELHGIAALPLSESAIAHLPRLPALHRDPFDRMLICQAIAHGMTLLTPDATIRRYPVNTLW
ncbi:MAG: type II toxin-antitoxin system VapC family toxin [Immundisolibacter sp.]|uniref:type II toxin-antitoxin system VapC family toxin n=1 Tax=Immundisolibacter sp. TaxID=1934948 RepID=UPI003EE29515